MIAIEQNRANAAPDLHAREDVPLGPRKEQAFAFRHVKVVAEPSGACALGAEVHPTLTVPGLLTLLDDGCLVMASVHKEIRRPANPAPGKGGHLVLVTGRQGDTVHFRNPSGHSGQDRTASLPVTEFAEFFGNRGVSLT